MENPASETSSLKSYAITISVTGKLGQTKYHVEEDIKKLLMSRWNDTLRHIKPTTSDYIFETSDKTTKLHLHGIFATYNKFTYTQLQVPGFQVYVRELRSPEEETNWFFYINKERSLFEDEQVHTLPTVAIDHGQKGHQ